tara:strand:+ start:5364 stop:6689 length:1326 start_codon:yes stop_codon:yes gene_type:complete
MEKNNLFKALLLSMVVIVSSCSKDSSSTDPVNPVLDCNGVANGTSVADDCGVCQQAYTYNFITHVATLLDDTTGVSVDPATTWIVMPGDANSLVDPYWNMSCAYKFVRNGASTVSYGGQTTRLNMADELVSSLKNGDRDLAGLQQMWETGTGFTTPDLDNDAKILRSKFSSGHTGSLTTVKDLMDNLLTTFDSEVLANWNSDASAGTGGEYTTASQGRTVHIDNLGREIDQCFAKSLIGGLCFDQAMKYLTLDAVSNTNSDWATGNYAPATSMEHKWDEGFGYVYGVDDNLTDANINGDILLGKYVNKFDDIKANVWDAMKAGRAAISTNANDDGADYSARDAQATIIKAELSKVIALKAIGYLRGAADAWDAEGGVSADYFHDLSEGWGFIISLQYTDWFDNATCMSMIAELELGNGLWDRNSTELNAMADAINAVANVE